MNKKISRPPTMVFDDDLWVFSERSINISKMNKRELYVAALECYKQLFKHNKRFHYTDYRAKISTKIEVAKYWMEKKRMSENILTVYAAKLEHIDERAAQLNIELSDNFHELKKEYESICQNDSKSRHSKRSIGDTAGQSNTDNRKSKNK